MALCSCSAQCCLQDSLDCSKLHRPFVKPLVLLTPKYLLHHRPATSALVDFSVGTFFNRVIDDGKVRTLCTRPTYSTQQPASHMYIDATTLQQGECHLWLPLTS